VVRLEGGGMGGIYLFPGDSDVALCVSTPAQTPSVS
jgi:hypothetical protein